MRLDKKHLRSQLIKKRDELNQETVLRLSKCIAEKLKRESVFKKAQTIAIYLSFRNEVDTWRLIKEVITLKKICVPVIGENRQMHFVYIDDLEHLHKNQYGIYEPISDQIVDKDEIDMVVVPLVGYNDQNYRIGYGGGYYDRYLSQYHGKKIGIAFQMQCNNDFVPDSYDIPLDLIITE